jgi:hypothetical protein
LADGSNGELGETGFDVARKLIDSGIARPDTRFAQEPGPRQERNGPAALHGADAPWDAARYTPPEGDSVDAEALQAFSTLAQNNRLSQAHGDAYLALHHEVMDKRKADLENQWKGWYRETERHYGDRLPEVVADIKASVGSDADASEFYRALEWAGLSFNPSVLRVLHRLSSGGRRW